MNQRVFWMGFRECCTLPRQEKLFGQCKSFSDDLVKYFEIKSNVEETRGIFSVEANGLSISDKTSTGASESSIETDSTVCLSTKWVSSFSRNPQGLYLEVVLKLFPGRLQVSQPNPRLLPRTSASRAFRIWSIGCAHSLDSRSRFLVCCSSVVDKDLNFWASIFGVVGA